MLQWIWIYLTRVASFLGLIKFDESNWLLIQPQDMFQNLPFLHFVILLRYSVKFSFATLFMLRNGAKFNSVNVFSKNCGFERHFLIYTQKWDQNTNETITPNRHKIPHKSSTKLKEALQNIVDSLKQALGADQPLSSSGEEQKTWFFPCTLQLTYAAGQNQSPAVSSETAHSLVSFSMHRSSG